MKYKIIASLTIITATIALVGGATMAWFTDSAEVPEASFTAGTVEIRAGQTVKADDGGDFDYHEYLKKAAEDNPIEVIDEDQGPAGSGNVKIERSDPDAVLELETGDDEGNFFSLGFGGRIIVKFEKPILNGDTIVVVEDTWGPPYPIESAKISVSYDKNIWHEIGIATNYDMRSNQTINCFKVVLPEGVEQAKYVKVEDTSNPEDFVGVTPPDTVDGFDVNAIIAINSPVFDEENWNPGDSDIRAYYVTNVGTKDIYVRAKISGEWLQFEKDEGEWMNWMDWEFGSDEVPITVYISEGWDKGPGGYLYYAESLDGTYNGHDDRINPTAELVLSLDLDGEKADNEYQGKRFVLSVEFEAIQYSHGASVSEWDWSPQQN